MLSTDSLTILKTLIVPSISITLLPIAIIIVPRKTQLFYYISGLPTKGVVKSICSNSKDYLETDLSQHGEFIDYVFIMLLSGNGVAVAFW